MVGKRHDPAVASALNISNVVAAFSEEQIERIVGLSKGRLRYWAKTEFFRPSFVEADGRLPYSRFYSFKDIVALRTLEMLRVQNNVPLQHLRKVAEILSHLKDVLWTRTTLYVVNRKVVLINPETEQLQEVLSGQYLLGIPIPLQKMIVDTETDVITFMKRAPETIGRVSQSRAIARNAYVVAGTRISVGSIIRLDEDGYSVDEIIQEYPDLTPEDIKVALQHGGKYAA